MVLTIHLPSPQPSPSGERGFCNTHQGGQVEKARLILWALSRVRERDGVRETTMANNRFMVRGAESPK